MREDENYLIFDGHKSTEWGVWVSGEDTWKRPARNVDSVSIPGRNGVLIIDNGFWENVQITYSAFVLRGSVEDGSFDDFLDFLSAHTAEYFRLEDAYHPDEYRLARVTGEIAPSMGKLNRTSKFTITFDCKPQRFLKSGAEPIDLAEHAESGYMVEIHNPTRHACYPIIRCAHLYDTVNNQNGSATVGNDKEENAIVFSQTRNNAEVCEYYTETHQFNDEDVTSWAVSQTDETVDISIPAESSIYLSASFTAESKASAQCEIIPNYFNI